MGKRKARAEGLRVDEDLPCEICGEIEPTEGRGPMLACDCCAKGACRGCLGLEVVPTGKWYCPTCSPWFEQARPGPPEPSTFEAARPPRLDKSERRREAGLGQGGLPTLDDVQRLKDAAVAPSTREKMEQVQRSFNKMTKDLNLDPASPDAFALFVAWRVKNGKAEQTIKSEMSMLRGLSGVKVPPEEELKRLSRAVTRLAECPGNAKDPITPHEMLILRREMMKGWVDDGEERHVRQLRNWCYCLLAFVGMFRPSELVELQWSSVLLSWRTGTRTVETHVGAGPEGGELTHATLHLLKSKTDPGARGQVVRIAAGAHHDMMDCPLQLMLKLYRHRRGNFVFEEVRKTYAPSSLTPDPFANAFKSALEAGNVSRERIDRLSLHSFRRGGATAADECGASIREIKTHGRWRSDVAYVYALVSDKRVTRVSQDLLKHLRELATLESE